MWISWFQRIQTLPHASAALQCSPAMVRAGPPRSWSSSRPSGRGSPPKRSLHKVSAAGGLHRRSAAAWRWVTWVMRPSVREEAILWHLLYFQYFWLLWIWKCHLPLDLALCRLCLHTWRRAPRLSLPANLSVPASGTGCILPSASSQDSTWALRSRRLPRCVLRVVDVRSARVALQQECKFSLPITAKKGLPVGEDSVAHTTGKQPRGKSASLEACRSCRSCSTDESQFLNCRHQQLPDVIVVTHPGQQTALLQRPCQRFFLQPWQAARSVGWMVFLTQAIHSADVGCKQGMLLVFAVWKLCWGNLFSLFPWAVGAVRPGKRGVTGPGEGTGFWWVPQGVAPSTAAWPAQCLQSCSWGCHEWAGVLVCRLEQS